MAKDYDTSCKRESDMDMDAAKIVLFQKRNHFYFNLENNFQLQQTYTYTISWVDIEYNFCA